jgi:hypothetical protein
MNGEAFNRNLHRPAWVPWQHGRFASRPDLTQRGGVFLKENEMTTPDSDEIYSMAELAKLAKLGRNRTLLIKYDSHLELLIYPHMDEGYPIEHHRINTPAKVLGWILHLYKKRTVSKEHLVALILAAKEFGVVVDYNM